MTPVSRGVWSGISSLLTNGVPAVVQASNQQSEQQRMRELNRKKSQFMSDLYNALQTADEATTTIRPSIPAIPGRPGAGLTTAVSDATAPNTDSEARLNAMADNVNATTLRQGSVDINAIINRANQELGGVDPEFVNNLQKIANVARTAREGRIREDRERATQAAAIGTGDVGAFVAAGGNPQTAETIRHNRATEGATTTENTAKAEARTRAFTYLDSLAGNANPTAQERTRLVALMRDAGIELPDIFGQDARNNATKANTRRPLREELVLRLTTGLGAGNVNQGDIETYVDDLLRIAGEQAPKTRTGGGSETQTGQNESSRLFDEALAEMRGTPIDTAIQQIDAVIAGMTDENSQAERNAWRALRRQARSWKNRGKKVL